ncbi:MAG: KilA-N domain-containing protein [Bifidobacteriaceae bacterium]|jgi:hypothetical protein|nr:KilA-N domain-containing protein [Bifidobacteriaceae bacterium]
MEKSIIQVENTKVEVIQYNKSDYISLTDIIKAKDGEFFVADWLRNRNTLEFLGIWEKIYNPNFNYGKFATIRNKSGLNNFKISTKEFIKKTNAISLIAKPGRYGGTYAHKDIAFEFGMWISPKFKIVLIKEFQRLKENELKQSSLSWEAQRYISKINYRIQTDSIKEHIIPSAITKEQILKTYSNEADLLNIALYGETAAEWKKNNPKLAKSGNQRDYSTLEQLIVLSNLESINAMLIAEKLDQPKRIVILNKTAIHQIKTLLKDNQIQKITNLK